MQIGIDVGGTKIEAIALAPGNIIAARRRIPTPREYSATLDALTRLVTELESETGQQSTVGIGIPGIAIGQRIHDGPNQIAGEWGHNPLPWMTEEEQASAPPCYCGRSGCIETFLSGPGFELDYARLTGKQ